MMLPFSALSYGTNQPAASVIGQTSFTQALVNSGGPNANSLNSAVGIFCDGTRVFIADRGNSRVLIFNSIPTGTYASADVIVGQASATGNACNQGGSPAANCLCFPSGVASSGSKLFIADSVNNRVLIFNSIPASNNASADLVVGQTNMASNQPNPVPAGYTPNASSLRGPTGIASDGTRLFIADTDNRRVLVFNTLPAANGAAANVVVGQPSMTSATCAAPQSASTLCNPVGLAVNGGRLFISDTATNRLLVFNAIPVVSGASADLVLGQASFSATSANQGGVPAANTLSAPWAVSTDGTRLFVADTGNHRVLIFNQLPVAGNTAADAVLGQAFFTGSGINQGGTAAASTLYGPAGVSVSGVKLLASDRNNNRVLIYDDPPTPTATSTATRTITQTHTFSPTATPSHTLSSTLTPTFSPTLTNTRTDSPTPTGTRTETPTRTGTVTRSPAPTFSETASATSTPSGTLTGTPSPTATPTQTSTSSVTPSQTSTATVSPAFSLSPTLSPTAPGTFTTSPTLSPTTSFTSTPSQTGTLAPSPSASATITPTPSPSLTATMAASMTPVPSAGLAEGLAQSFIYPSPARGGSAAIAYLCEKPARVQVRVYNHSGELAADLDEARMAGPQESRLDLQKFPAGIYYYLIAFQDAEGKRTLGPRKFIVLH